MKYRMGFVSNSSSSSFILCIVDSHRCPLCGRSDGNFLDMLQGGEGGDGDDTITAQGKEDILASLKDGWCLNETRLKAIEENMNRYTKGSLYMVSISNHRSTLQDLRDGEFKNVTIVETLGE